MVSVVLPTYNRGYVLKAAIDSVLAQTYADFELLIVDDGSRDNTKELVESYLDDSIKFIELGDNFGANHARNVGIHHAQGEYVAFIDSDCLWESNYLEDRLACVQKYEHPDLIYGRSMVHDSCTKVVFPDFSGSELSDREFIKKRILFNSVFDTNTMFIRKVCCQEIGGFNEQMQRLQDWELGIRLVFNDKYKIVFRDNILVHDYHQPDSISNQSELYGEARLYIFKETLEFCRENAMVADVLAREFEHDEAVLPLDIRSQMIALATNSEIAAMTCRLLEIARMKARLWRAKNSKIIDVMYRMLGCVDLRDRLSDKLLSMNVQSAYIYGNGRLGKLLYDNIRDNIVIQGILDSHKTGEYHGCTIRHPAEVHNLGDSDACVITLVDDTDSIVKSLLSKGIRRVINICDLVYDMEEIRK